MLAIVEFPSVVRRAMKDFGDRFWCEPQRKHFAEYLTGLMIAENKTVTGTNGEFVQTTDQSCLNRFLTDSKWNIEVLNSRRLEFRRFKTGEQCETTGETFQDHTPLFCELAKWACEREIPGEFAFDSYFTNAEILNHIDSKTESTGRSRGYVGDLKMNRRVEWKGKVIGVTKLAATIPASDRKEIRKGDVRPWCFTTALKIPKVNHRVRIVIIWNHRRDETPRKVLVSSRTNWEVHRVLEVYRDRWTGTETFHRDGKQALGMGDCQIRDTDEQRRPCS
jgi:hypothetical protein